MNRRTLLKRLGAAVVVAPIAIVAASEVQPAEAAPIEPYSVSAMPGLVAPMPDRFRKGYDQGLQRGLQARVHEHFDVENMLRVTVAEIDDKYVAAAREPEGQAEFRRRVSELVANFEAYGLIAPSA
jgi:hypothetical protein